MSFLVIRGPFGDMKVTPKVDKFDFTEQENESPYVRLALQDTAECNRLLSCKAINFRWTSFFLCYCVLSVLNNIILKCLSVDVPPVFKVSDHYSLVCYLWNCLFCYRLIMFLVSKWGSVSEEQAGSQALSVEPVAGSSAAAPQVGTQPSVQQLLHEMLDGWY